ncbi:hypothetical protein H1230_17270 [Paenibacillus sp. 19GGS1-52]|uniref:hypothetical protein n=1 Tax=Paenibacillus sp. 19GGS1-52 TaxID=2758563 RepID=UPI001EFB2ED6|nr:hypothetical protein [Paenibacillus sp. 19GGS1-52]ULO04891.1 hypothetical protein H1230_17270 [Paenibacillus sp. 19GGS1-52]
MQPVQTTAAKSSPGAPSHSAYPGPSENKTVDKEQVNIGGRKVLVAYFSKLGNISSIEDADAVSSAAIFSGLKP